MWPLVNKKLRVVGRTLGERAEGAGRAPDGTAGPSSATPGASPKGLSITTCLSSWQRVLEQRPEAAEPAGPGLDALGGLGTDTDPDAAAASGPSTAGGSRASRRAAGEAEGHGREPVGGRVSRDADSDSDVEVTGSRPGKRHADNDSDVEVTGDLPGKRPKEEGEGEEGDGMAASGFRRRAFEGTLREADSPLRQSQRPRICSRDEVIELD